MFEKYFYVLGILGAIGCLGLIDYRWKLAIAYDAKRALGVMTTAYAVFIVWDLLGTRLHIFFLGNSRFMTHLQITHNFMMEELFFVVLLVYLPLILWQAAQRHERAKGTHSA
jgi:lycopene cyclase domain-containing protein